MKTLINILLGLIILLNLIAAYTLNNILNNKTAIFNREPENYLIIKRLSQDEYMRKRKVATYNATLYVNKTNVCTFIVHLPEYYETNDTINLK